MTRRLAIACCVLLTAVPAIAQTRGNKDAAATRDAVTGTWAGELEFPTGRTSVTLQLKFDGKRTVTGTLSGLPHPGNVKTGTFDPKTGALNLQLGRTDGPTVLITLDGTIARGTATGRASGEPGDGRFTLTRKPPRT